MNIEHFRDLPPALQDELLHYIYENFSAGRDRHSAYGLKQKYTRLHPNAEYHITSRCFMEAMVHMGYEALPIENAKDPNWNFRVKVLEPHT